MVKINQNLGKYQEMNFIDKRFTIPKYEVDEKLSSYPVSLQ